MGDVDVSQGLSSSTDRIETGSLQEEEVIASAKSDKRKTDTISAVLETCSGSSMAEHHEGVKVEETGRRRSKLDSIPGAEDGDKQPKQQHIAESHVEKQIVFAKSVGNSTGGDACGVHGRWSSGYGERPNVPRHMNGVGTDTKFSSTNKGMPATRSHLQVRVRYLHVSSIILAAKSEFFRSMWKNSSMREGDKEKPTVLHITEDEEAPLMELLKLIYTGSSVPISTEAHGIVRLLKVADRYHVASCMRLCVDALRKLPYSVSLSILYLSLPESLQQQDEVRVLITGAVTFMVHFFQDLAQAKTDPQFLSLPLSAVALLLQSDSLSTTSEEAVFEAMLAWARKAGGNSGAGELSSYYVGLLAEHVRFPFIAGDYLQDVVALTPEMRSAPAMQLLLVEALKFKTSSPERQQRHVAAAKTHRRFHRRAATEQAVTFCWDVHKSELMRPIQAGVLHESQRFFIRSKWFKLQFRKRTAGETCGLYLALENTLPCTAPGTVEVDYRFYVKRWPSGEYALLHPSSKVKFTDGDQTAWGYEEPWQPISSCPHFNSDSVMAIRADLIVRSAPPP